MEQKKKSSISFGHTHGFAAKILNRRKNLLSALVLHMGLLKECPHSFPRTSWLPVHSSSPLFIHHMVTPYCLGSPFLHLFHHSFTSNTLPNVTAIQVVQKSLSKALTLKMATAKSSTFDTT
jgi:hypothetical protein